MKKIFSNKLLALFLTICFTACLVPFAAFADEEQKTEQTEKTETVQQEEDKKQEKREIAKGGNASRVYDGNEIAKSDVYALVSGKADSVTVFTYEWYDINGKKLAQPPVDAGQYSLVIKVSDKDPLYKGSCTITYTIEQRPLEWDVSCLTIKKPMDGTAAAAKVNGRLDVDGVIDGDEVTLNYDSITAADFPTAEVQRVSLPLTVENPTLTGADSHNYSLPKLSPVAEGAIVKATVKEISFEGDSNKYRLVLEEAVYVTEALEKTQYNTEEGIKTAFREKIKEHFADKEEVSTVFYTPSLQQLKGEDWVDVGTDLLVQNAAAVTLPYPEGTKNSSHEFVVYYLSSQGEKAGTIELIAHKELADGIEVTLAEECVVAVGSTPQKNNTKLLIIIGAIAVMVVAGTVFVKLHKSDKEETETEQTEE